MIQLYTGNGKGKTTAAIGQSIRSCGRGLSVVFAQFMKGNDTGELEVLSELPGVTILRSDKNFGFFRSMSEADKEELTGIHNEILDSIYDLLKENKVDLVVLDEITYPVKWGLLHEEKLKRILELSGKTTENQGLPELVLTGRDPADFLKEAADYISEIQPVRHPYEKGVQARRGIEY